MRTWREAWREVVHKPIDNRVVRLADYTSDEQIDRGREAELLLRNPALIDAFEEMRKQYLLAIEDTKPDEGDTRERQYGMLTLVHELHDNLKNTIRNGRNAVVIKEQEEKRDGRNSA